ncbi:MULTISPECIES: hypothetical protein [Helicobacter]|uniref:Uncharacterized protein n=1 Tax=Helicobacter ibis TaxID=2962633 RepID=A0ABT4VE39_9HELI|nr:MULTISPECIES: hypothetical protein [Helicobacter]MDA3966421.1 hypothetical protein [Helicobacter sp. WB40]MDA3968964.1 hypothetical protein [Helicobacter ibis]
MLSIMHNKNFQTLIKKHCFEIIKSLMDKKINFSIVCNISCVKFEPQLPDSIRNSFNDLTLFILAGYTFESLELDSNNLYFEAGFGDDNLGSFVTTPLESIVQIILPNDIDNGSDVCLFINIMASFAPEIKSENDGINSSIKAILSNPKNHKFKK